MSPWKLKSLDAVEVGMKKSCIIICIFELFTVVTLFLCHIQVVNFVFCLHHVEVVTLMYEGTVGYG